LPVRCFIKISGEAESPDPRWLPEMTFAEMPRVGEFVTFSRDGKPDDDGVLRADLFRVQHVIHTAASDLHPPATTLDVVVEQYARGRTGR
jgi:hypothetical protein